VDDFRLLRKWLAAICPNQTASRSRSGPVPFPVRPLSIKRATIKGRPGNARHKKLPRRIRFTRNHCDKGAHLQVPNAVHARLISIVSVAPAVGSRQQSGARRSVWNQGGASLRPVAKLFCKSKFQKILRAFLIPKAGAIRDRPHQLMRRSTYVCGGGCAPANRLIKSMMVSKTPTGAMRKAKKGCGSLRAGRVKGIRAPQAHTRRTKIRYKKSARKKPSSTAI